MCPQFNNSFAGTGIASVQGLSGLTKGDTVFIQKQERITKSFLSSTVAVNGLCTRSYLFFFFALQHFSCSPHLPHLSPLFSHTLVVLISYRLWTRQATLRDSRKAFGLTREVAIMAESGAIYSITLILLIATYASKSNSFNVFLDIVSSLPHN